MWTLLQLEKVINTYVKEVVHEIFNHNRLNVAINCAIVTLIPKTPAAKTMREIWPIAFCTTVYKIISETLTTWLNKVINVIIDESQYAFIPGKIIHENIIISHEVLRGYTRKHISLRCAIQIDIKKAYDTVEWTTLETIIREMKFLVKLIKWIMVSVSAVSYKYNIHGQKEALGREVQFLHCFS